MHPWKVRRVQFYAVHHKWHIGTFLFLKSLNIAVVLNIMEK